MVSPKVRFTFFQLSLLEMYYTHIWIIFSHIPKRNQFVIARYITIFIFSLIIILFLPSFSKYGFSFLALSLGGSSLKLVSKNPVSTTLMNLFTTFKTWLFIDTNNSEMFIY